MFTLPPLPPKDYVLRNVNLNQRSVQEHTPIAPPRITQANLAKFLSPLEYKEKEKLTDVQIDEVNPHILERWTDDARAFWVEKPGKDDFFLHDMCKKYRVEVEPSYDTRFKHKAEQVFYRSFKHELECLEHDRLEKLRTKTEREENEERAKTDAIEARKSAIRDKRQAIDLGIKPCKEQPPFWWKEPTASDMDYYETPYGPVQKPIDTISQRQTFVRWQDEPNFLQDFKANPCQRRRDMALIGQPFRSEACNFYYDNYPPPNLRFIQKKFA